MLDIIIAYFSLLAIVASGACLVCDWRDERKESHREQLRCLLIRRSLREGYVRCSRHHSKRQQRRR